MLRVYMYEFDPDDIVRFRLPTGAKVLQFGLQGDRWCLWALVDPLAPLEMRNFRMAGTGHVIKEEVRFVNTAMTHGGKLVFHFFEVL